MEILLPKLPDGRQIALNDRRQITLIGANGSGKSRFGSWLMTNCGVEAVRLSALKALYANTNDNDNFISLLYSQATDAMPGFTSSAATDFERLTAIMLADEFRELMNYKTGLLLGEKDDFPKTKLDTTIKMWQEVFPRNKVLRQNGKILFSNEGNDDQYPLLRLSDGEKTVLYYIGATLYAPAGAVILVEDPETFIHPSITATLWNVIEEMRHDCTFIYSTHDVDFAASRIDNTTIWVKAFDPAALTWDYEVIKQGQSLDDGIYLDLLGSRKPVLFIEGDATHSIDSRLYPLIFPEFTVKPLGSCDKVIETVRTFGSLQQLHHLDGRGIVDRDRRTKEEVQYLRKKNILVPNVAEVENIFLIEGVIRAVARHNHKNEHDVASRVKQNIIQLFNHELREQALQHVRHRVKRTVETKIDMKFRNINALEDHMTDLVNEIKPRAMYERMCRDFHDMINDANYGKILQVFNQKNMLGDCNVAQLCGYKSKDDYIKGVLSILKTDSRDAQAIRTAIKATFDLQES